MQTQEINSAKPCLGEIREGTVRRGHVDLGGRTQMSMRQGSGDFTGFKQGVTTDTCQLKGEECGLAAKHLMAARFDPGAHLVILLDDQACGHSA